MAILSKWVPARGADSAGGLYYTCVHTEGSSIVYNMHVQANDKMMIHFKNVIHANFHRIEMYVCVGPLRGVQFSELWPNCSKPFTRMTVDYFMIEESIIQTFGQVLKQFNLF